MQWSVIMPSPIPIARRAALAAAALAIALAVPASADSPVEIGPSTSTPPYVLPSLPGVSTTSILTVGDSVGGYRMVGIPDGLGAFDNEDGAPGRGPGDPSGTFTLLMNHELGPTQGTVRAHGSTGAFVSRWVISKDDLSVISGEDQIQQVFLEDPVTVDFTGPTTWAFNRLCSADLPAVTAFYDPATGLGTTDRILLNGEETRPPFDARHGKAFAHVVTGPENGNTYELNELGEMAFENVVASPYPQQRTIVMGLDDSSNAFTTAADPTGAATQPSEVYVYVGDKSASGNPVERAGLIGGDLFGVAVDGDPNEDTVASGDRFTLADLANADDGAALQAESVAEGVTQFRRVEDGHWDPTSPNDFYFVTTDGFGGQTRLFRLRFDDVTRPELGGQIDIVVDSGPTVPGEMFDNMTVDDRGQRALIQEDPGSSTYLARIWQASLLNGKLTEVAHHNPAFFSPGAETFLTTNEESSGIIDVSDILGPGWFLLDVQAHYPLADPELAEGGQLLALHNPKVGR